jgi:hypothetical protein
MVHPCVIAGGLRMFPDSDEMKLFKLGDVRGFDSGVALLTYRRKD